MLAVVVATRRRRHQVPAAAAAAVIPSPMRRASPASGRNVITGCRFCQINV